MVESCRGRFRQLAYSGLTQSDPHIARLEELVNPQLREERRTVECWEDFRRAGRESAEANPRDYERSVLRLGLDAKEIALSGVAVKSHALLLWPGGTASEEAADVKTRQGAVLSICSVQEFQYNKMGVIPGDRLCITIQSPGEDKKLKRAMG